MSRREVRWKRNPHIERALLQFSTDIPKSRHLDTPRSISRDRQGLWKPRIRVARLLFPAAVAFSTCTRNLSQSSPFLFRASASNPPLFQATFSSCSFPPPPPATVAPASKYRARRSWISGAGVPAARNCRAASRNKIARAAANITRRNPRSFVRAFHFVRPSATKSDVYRTPAYARFRLISIVIRLVLVMN